MADPIMSMPFGHETVEIFPGPYAHGGRDSAYCVVRLEEAEKMAYDAIGIALELRRLAGKPEIKLPLPLSSFEVASLIGTTQLPLTIIVNDP